MSAGGDAGDGGGPMTSRRELAKSYLRGWQDAAACKSMDQTFQKCPDSEESLAYDAGYYAGTLARRAAIKEAQEKYGHKFLVVSAQSATGRLQGNG